MEFAAYSGPPLDSLVAWGKLVLVGDASHPSAGKSTFQISFPHKRSSQHQLRNELTRFVSPGGFGSGSAFAMEDGWTLAQAIAHARSASTSIADAVAEALRMFDAVRQPYYKKM